MPEHRVSFVGRWLASRSARAAAGVLAAWVTVALFAPLLANDRPFAMRATDRGGFEDARAELAAVTGLWLDLEAGGEAAWRAQAGAAARLTFEETLARERGAVLVRVEKLQRELAPEEASGHAALGEFALSVRAPRAERLPVDLRARVAALARDLRPARDPADSSGVRLASRVSAPLLATLTALDAGAIAAWSAFGLALVLSRSARARLAAAAAAFVLVTLAWSVVAPRETGPASIKQAASRGDLVVEWAVFPPIPMGYAETHMREAHAPPSWWPRREEVLVDAFGRSPERTLAGTLPFEPELDSPWRHLLGTDSLGRDLLARLVWGARVSLFVGAVSAVLLTLVGVALGVLAGWRGGWTDFWIARAIEVVSCFPAFVLVLCALFFVDPASAPPLLAVAVVIGAVSWPSIARLVRAEALRVRELDFVAAARALGLTEGRILTRHVLPNAIQPAIIAFAFAVGAGVLTESALAFLGFGVQVPVASWGALVSDSKSPDHAWIWIAPGLAIFTLVASCNVLGEALRDALDPRHEH